MNTRNDHVWHLLQTYWYKKDVVLNWEGQRLSLAVAQELFSSHTVDSGSLLLLRSLDMGTFADTGTALDFGCGCGVLGLGFKAVKPGWDVTLIDRDALAVEFSAWNASRLGLDVTCTGGLDTDEICQPPDLVLWNVPGKAGAGVVQTLTGRILDRLAQGGMLALVVVHPLASELEEAIDAHPDVDLVHQEAGTEHTVMHVRRESVLQQADGTDAFAAGVFDRELTAVDTGLISYDFLPVVGIPQYDGPDYATVLLTDAIEGADLDAVASALVVGPGQGHVPVYLEQQWPECQMTLADRDLLALRASARVLPDHVPVSQWFGAAQPVPGDEASHALVTAMLPRQLRPVVMEFWLDQFLAQLRPGGSLVVGGGSTEVSRWIAFARKRAGMKLRSRDKRKGFSSALFQLK